MAEEIDIKNTQELVKALVRDHGIAKARELIERDFKHYPDMKNMMLGIWYVEYGFIYSTKKRKA